jgi:hypothetical protein
MRTQSFVTYVLFSCRTARCASSVVLKRTTARAFLEGFASSGLRCCSQNSDASPSLHLQLEQELQSAAPAGIHAPWR